MNPIQSPNLRALNFLVRPTQISLLVAAMLAGSSILLRSADTEAVQSPTQIIDIEFVGFTDGLHFVVNNSDGVVTGNYTGSDNSQIVGLKCKLTKQRGVNAIVFRSQYNRVHVIRFDRQKTWTYYAPDGSIFNSGTWAHVATLRAGNPSTAQGSSNKLP